MSFPIGRTKLAPAILAPFQHPPQAEVLPSKWTDVLKVVKKVRCWAEDLENGVVKNLSAIARKEGLSVARVSQLMPLRKIEPDEIEKLLASKSRVSLQRLITLARR